MAESEQQFGGSDYIIVREGTWELGNRKGAYTCDENGVVTATCEGYAQFTSTSQFVFNACSSDALPLNPPSAPVAIELVRNDVMALIANPENAGASFLLPSQLNGAEYATNARPTTRVKDYVWDCTGGPAGQLSGHLGIATFILDNAENNNHLGSGINSVREFLPQVNPNDSAYGGFSDPLQNVNGYLKVASQVDDAASFMDRIQRNLHRIRVPAMLNVQASGLLPGRRKFSSGQHNVNLIYGSGVPVGTYGNDLTQFVSDVAFQIVVSQYYGGIKLAAMNENSSQIYLMLLGAGVFNMEIPTVVQAIERAIDLLYADENVRERLSDLKITILTYGSFETQVVQKKLELRNARLRQTYKYVKVQELGEKRRSIDSRPSVKRQKSED